MDQVDPHVFDYGGLGEVSRLKASFAHGDLKYWYIFTGMNKPQLNETSREALNSDECRLCLAR